MRLLTNEQVGLLRRLLFVKGTHRWNGLVRGITAKLG